MNDLDLIAERFPVAHDYAWTKHLPRCRRCELDAALARVRARLERYEQAAQLFLAFVEETDEEKIPSYEQISEAARAALAETEEAE